MTHQNIRFIHYVAEKLCIAVQSIDDDYCAIAACFAAPNDNYSRKFGRAIAATRANSISAKPDTRYAMIVPTHSFQEKTLIGIWKELHVIIEEAMNSEEIADSYCANDNFWGYLVNKLDAEVAATR